MSFDAGVLNEASVDEREAETGKLCNLQQSYLGKMPSRFLLPETFPDRNG